MSEPTVFIIDDDDACRDSIRELVVAVGLAAAVFGSAFEFLAAFDPAWRGCLVLDLRMPWMNGLALQKRLQEMGVQMPIVFVSGSVDISTAVQAIRDGAVDFLQKPYPQQQLLDAIYKALRCESTFAHSMSGPVIIDDASAGGGPLG
ncbi:response regulator [Variovorax sp. J22P240]|uniref:response regulator transcription factor n=1 Tax=unclassified Variovorax TaxID=663243 RepID=UPI00257895EB|nr:MULTISPECIES: response regulator [unclassified Variovorax]MDL9997326.1 response regulator [Variovorax sp. J22P240]MDM0048078.1 response regulator [Variovorax sp. J22R115]